MICKKCNEVIKDGQCPICGEKPKLVNRSNELDTLMLQTQKSIHLQTEVHVQPQIDNPTRPQTVNQKTYQQGLELGYQNGLRDGYKKATGENRKADYHTELTKKRIYVLLIMLLVVVAVTSVISGVVNYRRGLRHGEEKGFSMGVEKGTSEKADSYNEGYSIGKQEGFEEGYQSGLSESQQPGEIVGDETNTSVKTDELYSRAKQKSKGIMTIQRSLNTLLGLNLKEDGQFGDGTERAIKQFQEIIGLDTTGIVDPETLGWLFFFWDHVEEFRSKYGLLGDDGQINTQPTEPTPSDDVVPSETPVSLNMTESPETTIVPYVTSSPEDETQVELNAASGTDIVPYNPTATDGTNIIDNKVDSLFVTYQP